MERKHTDRRERRSSVSRQCRETRPRDRRSHDRAAAVRKFREWDQAMQRRHGPLYHQRLGYTLH